MVEFGPRFSGFRPDRGERPETERLFSRSTRAESFVPQAMRGNDSVLMMAASTGGGSDGGDDQSWRTEGLIRARTQSMWSGLGRVWRRLQKFVDRAISLEMGGAVVGTAGLASIGYGTLLATAGTGAVLAGAGFIAAGAAAVGAGILIWRAGRWLSRRVDGVAFRTFQRQAERNTRDYG